jgi:hypothetical protein
VENVHHLLEHVPHPHIEHRKKFLDDQHQEKGSFNNWLGVKVTNIVGTMWCAYAFAALAFISLPDAIKAGTSALVAWIAQTFLQLVLLSIIMVGQKVASKKTDQQLEQTFKDAEALLQTNDAMHRLMKQNVALTGQINDLMRQNTTLTQQIGELLQQRDHD